MYVAIKTLLDPARDEVLLVEPAYTAYAKIAQLEGIAVRTVGMPESTGFSYDPDAIVAALAPGDAAHHHRARRRIRPAASSPAHRGEAARCRAARARRRPGLDSRRRVVSRTDLRRGLRFAGRALPLHDCDQRALEIQRADRIAHRLDDRPGTAVRRADEGARLDRHGGQHVRATRRAQHLHRTRRPRRTGGVVPDATDRGAGRAARIRPALYRTGRRVLRVRELAARARIRSRAAMQSGPTSTTWSRFRAAFSARR